MAWIESHQSLRTHWKVQRVASDLHQSPFTVIGLLHSFWWWAIDNSPTGDLSKFTPYEIETACGWSEHSRLEELGGQSGKFVSALLRAEFIDRGDLSNVLRDEDSSKQLGCGARIHDWWEFCGDLMRKRIERQREKRNPQRGYLSEKSPPTVPNRTVPNRTTPPYSPPAGAFDSLWANYPRRLGKKAALRHFNASVKTPQDLLDVQKALANFIREMRKEGRANNFVSYGSTWFNNWRDWVTHNGPPPPLPPKPRAPDPLPHELVDPSAVSHLVKSLATKRMVHR